MQEIPIHEVGKVLGALGATKAEIKKKQITDIVDKCPLCGEETHFRDWQMNENKEIYHDYICLKCKIGYYVHFEATKMKPYSEERKKELKKDIGREE